MMPMPLACLFHLALGLAFSLAARDRIRVDGPYASPAFSIALAHVGLVVIPLGLYFYLVQPDWTWLYGIDPGRIPRLAAVPLVAAHAGLVIAGWHLGAQLVRRDRTRLAVWLAIGLAVAIVVGAALVLPRLATAATYAGYHHGERRALMSVELGWAVLVSLLATSITAGYTAFELTRDSRRARTR
jgi:hypothetical protein